MKTLTAIFLFTISAVFCVNAQRAETNGRLYVLNEGPFGGLGSIGYIDLPCREYKRLDSIPAFGNDLELRDGLLYGVAGGDIYAWNVENDYQRAFVLEGAGAVDIDFSGDYLIAACNTAPFIKVYDAADDYVLVFESDSAMIPNEAASVLAVENRAFITINGLNGFGVNGEVDNKLAVLDLDGFGLDTLPIMDNPVAALSIGDELYINALAYDAEFNARMTIANFELSTPELAYVPEDNLEFEVAGGTFEQKDGNIYLLGRDSVLRVDPVSGEATAAAPNEAFYAFLPDAQADAYFYSVTDFATAGSVGVLGADVPTIEPIETHVAPRRFLMDYETEVDGPLVRFEIPEDSLVLDVSGELEYLLSATTDETTVVWSISFNGGDFMELDETSPELNFIFEETGTYVFSVYALNENGCWSALAADTVFVDAFTSLKGFAQLENARVFPNPASGSVYLQIPPTAIGLLQKVEITDLSGRSIREIDLEKYGNNKINIPLDGMAKGVYALRFKGEEIALSRKIVVN